jgi:hypothetical protein
MKHRISSKPRDIVFMQDLGPVSGSMAASTAKGEKRQCLEAHGGDTLKPPPTILSSVEVYSKKTLHPSKIDETGAPERIISVGAEAKRPCLSAMTLYESTQV